MSTTVGVNYAQVRTVNPRVGSGQLVIPDWLSLDHQPHRRMLEGMVESVRELEPGSPISSSFRALGQGSLQASAGDSLGLGIELHPDLRMWLTDWFDATANSEQSQSGVFWERKQQGLIVSLEVLLLVATPVVISIPVSRMRQYGQCQVHEFNREVIAIMREVDQGLREVHSNAR